MRKLLIAISLLFCLAMVDQAGAYEIVLENYALNGATSALDNAWGWVQSRAVDGNTGSGYHSTEANADHWWEVDMGQPHDFERIEILNRAGGNPPYVDRLNGTVIKAFDGDYNLVFEGPAIADGPMLVQYDNGGAGFTGVQYIRAEQYENLNPPDETFVNILTLMEVRALKILNTDIDPGHAISLENAVAMQTTPNSTYPASNALDGNYGNFTHTDPGTPNNYWELDLNETVYMDSIIVYNRSSCCGERLINTVLTVMDEDRNVVFSRKFTAADGISNGSVHNILTMALGRYIRIGLENDEQNGGGNYVISLGEVEVITRVPAPWNESPVNGSIEVHPDENLTWTGGADPNTGVINEGTTGYHLYVGTDERAVNIRDENVYAGFIEVGSELYDADLSRDTTYYWAVDQQLGIGDANTLRGDNWSFTTELTLPVIDVQPADQVTFADGYAIFTITATDPLGEGLDYEWSKVGDGTVLSTTDTLELIGVSAEDAGLYVCNVSNIHTIQSQPAALRIAKPVVDWKFNETAGKIASDSSGNGIDGQLSDDFTDADWIVDGGRTGLPGDNALDFSADPNTNVLALDVDLASMGVTDIFKGDSSWTMIMYVNFAAPPASFTNLGGFGSCEYIEGDGSGNSSRYFVARENTDLEFEYGAWGLWPGTDIQATQWQMIAATYDAEADVLRLFYNGNQVASIADMVLDDTTENAFKIDPGIFALRSPGLASQGGINGKVDDFSVWDDALDAFELRALMTGYECHTAIPGDLNNDCRVDLGDLFLTLSSWLDCAIVPDCL